MAYEFKHTPRPWRISKGPTGRRFIVAAESRVKIGVICDKRNCADGDEAYSAEPDVADANAALVIASPDMFEALLLAEAFLVQEREIAVACYTVGAGGDESTMDEDGQGCVDEIDNVLTAVRDAMAKATGGAGSTVTAVVAGQGEKGG